MTMGNIRGHLAFISNHHIKHISKIDCWTTQLGARVRITVPESCSAHTIHQLCHQSSVQQLTYTKTVNAGIQRHPHSKPTMWIIRDLHCNGQFQAHSVWFQCIATLGNCSRTSRHHSVLTNGLDLQNDCLWHHNCRKHSKLYT
ncbi:hypothetical protein BDEG_23122 [Batrachochytrium dendrobatidis JEL423]|uniref:Uncharacterized protein n=1 Tax=Batrachochytrium dendrobatidis (strain JEL423) TaxID=403673 RepID=A0A177WID4_BATDL|nr:hypothetical protein BDEG_23122 [Batrachochytrium dendrobatidis JEL423]